MMFKDKYIHKFYAFALAAVFALTLAGCGGGGGTAAAPDPEPPAMPEPTPQETCEGDGGRYNADGSCTSAEDLAAEMTEAEALSAAQEAAMTAYMAAMAAVAGAVDPVAATNAQPHATAAMAASASAAAATDSATAMEHQAAAEAARDMAVEAGMTRGLGITTRANAASNQAAIDSATLVGVPAPAPVSNAGRVGRAMAAAATTVAAGADGNVDGSATTTNPDTTQQGAVVTSSARNIGSGPRFTVMAPTGGTATPQLRGESPTAITTRGGWAGAELLSGSGAPGGNRGYALVFTDINPAAQSYYTAVDTTIPASANFRNADQLAANVDTTETTGQSVNRAVIGGEIPGDGSHFVGTYNQIPTDNNPPVPGRFFCGTGVACSISVDASGVLRGITGYVFQPAIAGSVMRGDSDYMTWGVWVNIPNDPQQTSGTTTADAALTNPATAAAFASGRDPFQVPADLTGTATYNGVANGLYAAGGMVEYFEADASLSADFGGRRANDSDPRDGTANDNGLLGAVTGSITNIKAGGMDVEGSLTLGRAPLLAGDPAVTTPATAPTADSPANVFRGNTQGSLGGRAIQGSWTGRFYGPQRAQGVAIRTEFPTTAAGTFGARTPAGAPGVSILGSFGTWRAE